MIFSLCNVLVLPRTMGVVLAGPLPFTSTMYIQGLNSLCFCKQLLLLIEHPSQKQGSESASLQTYKNVYKKEPNHTKMDQNNKFLA